ncbi:MAG: hypothetical protein ACI4JJ_02700 [Huintestinicola sp.]
MLEDIISYVCDYSSQKVKISKGAVILIALASFIIGLLTGTVIAKASCGKKGVVKFSGRDFDADEYVRTLNFDDEEE